MNHLSVFLAASEEYLYGTFAEKLALSGRFLLIGMGTVFVVLVLLWLILAAFGAAASAANGESKKAAPAKTLPEAPKPAAEPEPTEAPAADPEFDHGDEGAVVAAICAAIEAYRASEGQAGLPYRVVSFKRKSGKKSWNGSAED